MKNNLQKLRKQSKLSQTDLAKMLGVTRQAISLYEQGKRQLKEKDINTLIKYFNVSKKYLLGAYSKDEIMEFLPRTYKNILIDQNAFSLDEICVATSIAMNIDLISIAKGYIKPTVPKLVGSLDQWRFNDLSFFYKNFDFVFGSVAVKWLITKPMEVSQKDILEALDEALNAQLFKLSQDNTKQTSETGQSIPSPKELLSKRQKFIDDNSVLNPRDGGIDHMKWEEW